MPRVHRQAARTATTPATTPASATAQQPAGNPPADLQKALDAGGVINATGGKYTGQFTVSKANTHLLGGEIVGRLFVKANDVTIEGLDIHGGNAAPQEGQIDVPKGAAQRLTLHAVHSHHGGGTGIRIRGGAGHVIDGCEIDNMDALGYALVDCTSPVMRNSKIHDNNPNDAAATGFEAGGGKMVGSTDALFEANECFGNHGPGMWEDLYNQGSTYRGNRNHGNTGAGIMVEISYDALVTQNVLWDNYHGQGRTWFQSGQILSHSAPRTQVIENLIAHGDIGIAFDAQPRANWPDAQASHQRRARRGQHDHRLQPVHRARRQHGRGRAQGRLRVEEQPRQRGGQAGPLPLLRRPGQPRRLCPGQR